MGTNRHKQSSIKEIPVVRMKPRHNKMHKAREIPNPVNEESINKMVVLEDRTSGKLYKMKDVSDLCELYRNYIEYYNAKKDDIWNYFKQKLDRLHTNMDFLKALGDADDQGLQGEDYDDYEIERRITVTDEMRYEARNRTTVGRFGNAAPVPKEHSPRTQKKIREHNIH